MSAADGTVRVATPPALLASATSTPACCGWWTSPQPSAREWESVWRCHQTRAVASIVPSYLWRFRRSGQFRMA